MKKEKLAIFDLDGTLYDTKNVNFQAYKEALRQVGLHSDIDYRFYCDFCNGSNYKVFLPIIDKAITAEEMRQVHDIKKKIYSDYLSSAKRNEHLFAIIDLIQSEYIIALVTNASRKNTMDILTAFGDADRFDLILTQEDMTEVKPSPSCFLTAMKTAGIGADKCLIFEDSDVGIAAAKSSGANYMQVYGYN